MVIQQIYIRSLRGQTQDKPFAEMGARVRILIDKGCRSEREGLTAMLRQTDVSPLFGNF